MAQRLAVFGFILVLCIVVFLFALLPLDAVVYDWIQTCRSCAGDRVAVVLKRTPVFFLLGVGVVVLITQCVHGQWDEARRAAIAVLLGALLCEVLKAGLNRARPSAVSPLLDGNSFPSGHIMNATLIAGALMYWIARQYWAWWVKLGGAFGLLSVVGVVIWQRLTTGSHWFSDVIGSGVLAVAWLCVALPQSTLLQPMRRAVFVGAGFLVCLVSFQLFPGLRITLPSVVSTTGDAFLTLSFGELTPPLAFSGVWVGHSREPAGPLTWMGSGPAHIGVQLPPGPQVRMLRLAVRPSLDANPLPCVPLEIFINHRPAARLLLYRGWREYPLRVDPAWFTPGANLLTFRVSADPSVANPAPHGVAFLRIGFFGK